MNTEKPTAAQLALLRRIALQPGACLTVPEVRGRDRNTSTSCTNRGWTRLGEAKWSGLDGHYLTTAGLAILAEQREGGK